MSDFEREIEQELHRVLDPSVAGSIPAWRVPSPRSFTKRLLSGAGAALGVKVLTGLAVAAAAATIAGAATETAITGSVSPTVWGQQVKMQVDACKDKLSDGQHGIGECVSEFAKKHGETESDTKQSPEATATKNSGDKKPAHPGEPAKNSATKKPTNTTSTEATEHRPTPTPPRP